MLSLTVNVVSIILDPNCGSWKLGSEVRNLGSLNPLEHSIRKMDVQSVLNEITRRKPLARLTLFSPSGLGPVTPTA